MVNKASSLKLNQFQVEELKESLKPFVKKEVKRALLELSEQEKDLLYPPEDRIRESFIKRVKEAEKRMDEGHYSSYTPEEFKAKFLS